MTLSVLSRQYVDFKVVYSVAGVISDPTGFTVKMAFVAEGAAPQSSDFVDASWITGEDEYRVQTLVGTGGDHALDAGTYDGWVKILSTPEIVVEPVDKITIV